jgi:hypothetical protein
MNEKYYEAYINYKNRYLSLKQAGGDRGLMIQAPMGTGKSYYIKNRVPGEHKNKILDGDELLKKLNIKNRNYFWYDESREKERQKIIDAFDDYLNRGYFILYSGHPILIKTDVLVIPDKKTRWDRLQKRDDFKPTKEQFDREQEAYEEARDKIPFVINGDIPSFSILLNIRNN